MNITHVRKNQLNMKKVILFIAFFCCIATISMAQSMGTTYKSALGVKVLDGAGITFKTFVTDRNAVELIGFFWKRGTRITGLYEIHGNIEGARGLKWYIGPGAHVGFYDDRGENTYSVAGLDGVLGLDLKINKAPINLSIDWQPSFEFGNNNGFVGSWGGLGIRYAF